MERTYEEYLKDENYISFASLVLTIETLNLNNIKGTKEMFNGLHGKFFYLDTKMKSINWRIFLEGYDEFFHLKMKASNIVQSKFNHFVDFYEIIAKR